MTTRCPPPLVAAAALIVALAFLGPAPVDGLTAAVSAGESGAARVIDVAPGESIQAAIDAAKNGETIQLADGEYEGPIDFMGKSIRILGGRESLIVGKGKAPVVSFKSGEGPGSVLDGVGITGGRAKRGAGIFIQDASPIVVRSIVAGNVASAQGSGIFIGGDSTAYIFNNLVIYNTHSAGDPHAIEIVKASPMVVNNTVVRNDSNGLIIRGAGAALVHNNIFAWNGAKALGRGRGICDFSSLTAWFGYNDFHRNVVSAILYGGQDWKKVRRLQRRQDPPLVRNNRDGNPAFLKRPPATLAKADISKFALKPSSKLIDAGDPAPACNDLDGSRNDMGFTGGPFALGTQTLPSPGACGTQLPAAPR